MPKPERLHQEKRLVVEVVGDKVKSAASTKVSTKSRNSKATTERSNSSSDLTTGKQAAQDHGAHSSGNELKFEDVFAVHQAALDANQAAQDAESNVNTKALGEAAGLSSVASASSDAFTATATATSTSASASTNASVCASTNTSAAPAKTCSRKVTMQDVARYAGVSYQTVSRVLNTPDKVSEATKQKIDQAISELKYVPNLLARQLGKAERNVIGVINVTRAIQSSTGGLMLLKRLADKQGYKLMLMLLEDPTYDNLKQCMDELHSQMISKVLINAPLNTELAELMVQEYPDSKIIFLDVDPLSPVQNVCFNPFDGTLASVRYLRDLGHKKIAIIRGPSGQVTSDLRFASWQRCADSLGIEIVAVQEGNWTSEGGYMAMKRLIDQSSDFTALILGNDEMALGAAAVLHQYNLNVPHDMSIIGYDNIVDSAFFLPALTTVSLNRKKQIEIAYTKLLSDDTTSSLLPTDLVIRNSCCRPHSHGGVDLRQLASTLRNVALRLDAASQSDGAK